MILQDLLEQVECHDEFWTRVGGDVTCNIFGESEELEHLVCEISELDICV